MNSDCIVIQGSNMAEAHPVGFQWVMEAKKRGATVIHVDPRFTRTSAMADLHVPIRAGSDIAFLGGLIHHVLETGAYFEEYVRAYTNAPMIVRDDFQDTEDLDGLFSGFDAATGTYDVRSWRYKGVDVEAAAGPRDDRAVVPEFERGQIAGSGGAPMSVDPIRDDTLQDPRCVFQILRRHYARYTPEMVHEICGIPPETFAQVADALTRNSGRERTSAFCYAVGWTHHTVGVQYIRAASILQSLLGNIGRPGSGLLALRGHASIQGSTDIPTLFDMLPGYIPMPHAHREQDLETFIAANTGDKGFWGDMDAYVVSLLKAWFGEAATPENDYCFDYLPRLTGDHSSFRTVMDQTEGKVPGYFVIGENPAVGTANSRQQRRGLAELDWLVVRDLNMIETATFWKDGPEIETGEMRTADIGTEVFFLPAAAHSEKDGTFTNTQRLLQWHHKAVDPPGDCRSDLWFFYELGRRIKERLAGSTDQKNRAIQALTWDYPLHDGEPSADSVLREINGTGPDGAALNGYAELRADGSTACGCWIYSGVYAGEVNRSMRRTPGQDQDLAAHEWGWAWPANRRVLYNRASADPAGKPWSERKKLIWWDGERWTGDDVPDFPVTTAPDYQPPEGARAADAIGGAEPFVMQGDGRAWLFAPAGVSDGPMPAHYEPQESPLPNALHPRQRANPAGQRFDRPGNRYHPEPGTPGADVFPYVFTTFRVTEHHTAGGMSRWTPRLNELMPEMFLEVSPELAALRGLQNGRWAHVVTARSAVEGKVLVTDRVKPLTLGKGRPGTGGDGDRVVHQIGVPWHWGSNGLSTGDAANDLLSVVLDPNVHIMETKAATCDIRPGRRPRGPDLVAYLVDYRRRAGLEGN